MYKTKSEALKHGNAVKMKMTCPSAWKVVVDNNLGWYFILQSGNVSLHEIHDGGNYYAFVSEDIGSCSGLALWTTEKGFSADPNIAVKLAVDEALRVSQHLLTMAISAGRYVRGV